MRRTPSEASSASVEKSVGRPSAGVWSILKSPVWMTRPAGVVIARPMASGMEWHTRKNSIPNLPILNGEPGSTTLRRASRSRPCSFSFTVIRPWASREE